MSGEVKAYWDELVIELKNLGATEKNLSEIDETIINAAIAAGQTPKETAVAISQ